MYERSETPETRIQAIASQLFDMARLVSCLFVVLCLEKMSMKLFISRSGQCCHIFSWFASHGSDRGDGSRVGAERRGSPGAAAAEALWEEAA